MYIRKSTRKYKGKIYTNHLLVESVQTPKGPRQRIICSLGSLDPGPAEEWLVLAHKLESALQGQEPLLDSSVQIQDWAEKARRKKRAARGGDKNGSAITIQADTIEVEQAREAGPVHVGHQLWNQLGMNRILQKAGLSERACILTEVMTLNRLICPRSEHAMPDWIRRTALGDILKQDFSKLQDEALYRNLDRLHPNREHIERFEVRLRLVAAPAQEVGEETRTEAPGSGNPGLVLAVDEVEKLRLDVLRAGALSHRIGSERCGRMLVASAGEAAEVVGQKVGGDVFDGPTGADGRRVPLGRCEGAEEVEEGLSLLGEEVESEDGFEGLH